MIVLEDEEELGVAGAGGITAGGRGEITKPPKGRECP